ncbi:MAG: hypothetical protein ABMA01_16795 [Chthoniobacteraceae bacterium]
MFSMHRLPSDNSKRIHRVVWATGAVALGGGLLFYFLGNSLREQDSWKKPDGTQLEAPIGVAASDPGIASGRASIARVPEEHAEAWAAFRKQYDELKALIAAWRRKEEFIQKAHPEIRELKNLENKLAAYISENYAAQRTALGKFESENPEKALKGIELMRFAKPVEFVALLGAEDELGEKSLGSVIENLQTQTSYFESLRNELARIHGEVFHDPKAQGEAASIKNPGELMDALRAIAPRCREEHRKLLTATYPADLQEYVQIAQRYEIIMRTSQLYAESWKRELEPDLARIRQSQQALSEIKKRVPRLSEANVEMGKMQTELVNLARAAGQ